MAIGIKNTSNQDLDTIFKARVSAKISDVGVYYNNGGQTDISNRYEGSIGGDQVASNTGIRGVSGVDLKSLFQDISYGGGGTGPSITTQPSSTTIPAGSIGSFSVNAAGTATLLYQWYKWNGSSYAAISGATSSSYVVFGVTDANDSSYYCNITNGFGTIDTTVVTMTVQTSPSVTSHPSDVTDSDGASRSMSISATGDAQFPNSYQWQKWNGSSWVNVSGQTSTTFSFTVNSSTEGIYRCQVIGYSTIYSNNATVALSAPVTAPTITVISGESVVGDWVYFNLSDGNVAEFICSYTGSTPTWTWYDWDGVTYNVISGQTTSTYHKGEVFTGTLYFKVRASNSAGSHEVEIEVTVT